MMVGSPRATLNAGPDPQRAEHGTDSRRAGNPEGQVQILPLADFILSYCGHFIPHRRF